MVPFRPHPRTAKGKSRWREIKVAILARLGARLSHQGTRVSRLCQRRLVAVLGAIDDLAPRLWLEAVRQGVRTAMQVVWLSDGGRGLWSVFQRLFQAVGAVAILEPVHNLSEIPFIYSHILATVSLFSRPGQNCYISLCYLSFQRVKKDPEQALTATERTDPILFPIARHTIRLDERLLIN